MGFNKKFIPSLEELKAELEKTPERLSLYAKADAWVGPSDSIEYLESLLAKK